MTAKNFINGTYEHIPTDNLKPDRFKLVFKILKAAIPLLIITVLCGIAALYVSEHTEHIKYTQIPDGMYYKTGVDIRYINNSNLHASINSTDLTILGSGNELIINSNVSKVTFRGLDNTVFVLPDCSPVIVDKGHNNKVINQIF